MAFEYDLDFDNDFIYEIRPLQAPIQKILSLAQHPFYEQSDTADLNHSKLSQDSTTRHSQFQQLPSQQPLLTVAATRPTLNIQIQPPTPSSPPAPVPKCRDLPKYMINRIVDMLYVRTDIQDKLKRRKTVANYSREPKRELDEAEVRLCTTFIEETKKNHNFEKVREFFGVPPGQVRENRTADLFRLESYRYFESNQAAFDYVGGEMNFGNKLAVIRKLNRMSEMCVNPQDMNTLSD